jgi:hypothetical protein
MNHLQCHCGATFPHIAALMDHRLTDAPHVRVRTLTKTAPPAALAPPVPAETHYAPCTRCTSIRGNSLPGYGRGWRSENGLCARCFERNGGMLVETPERRETAA